MQRFAPPALLSLLLTFLLDGVSLSFSFPRTFQPCPQLDAFSIGLVTSDEFTNAEVQEETYALLGDHLRATALATSPSLGRSDAAGASSSSGSGSGSSAALSSGASAAVNGAGASGAQAVVIPVITGFLGKVRGGGGNPPRCSASDALPCLAYPRLPDPLLFLFHARGQLFGRPM